MNVADGDVDVVEQLGVVLDAVAAAEEHHHFLLQVLLQEREQQQEPLLARHHAVPLLDASRGAHRPRVVDADVGGRLEGETREVLNLRGLRGAEQHGLPVLGNHANDGAHLLLEPDVEHAVRLVHAEHLQATKREPLGVLHVVQQPAWGGDQQVDAPDQLLRLRTPVGASDDEPVRLRVLLHELLRHVVDLERELPRRGEHHHAGAVAGHELAVVQELDRGNEERERLTGTGARGAEDVAAREEGRDGPRLHLGHLRVPELVDARHGGLGQGDGVERLVAQDSVHLHLDTLALGRLLLRRLVVRVLLLLVALLVALLLLGSGRLLLLFFLLRRLPLLVVHAGHRRRLGLLALALLGGELCLLLHRAESLELLRGHSRASHGGRGTWAAVEISAERRRRQRLIKF